VPSRSSPSKRTANASNRVIRGRQNLHGQSPNSGPPDLVEPDGGGGVTVIINLTK